jgi:hypothetical protein
MSPLRRPRAGRLRGARSRTATRLLLSALIVIGTLLLVRVPGGGMRGDAASDVCVGPVPVDGPCSTTTGSATESATTTDSVSTTGEVTTTSASSAGSETATTTSSDAAVGAGTETSTATTTSASTAPTARPSRSPSPTHFPAPPPPLPLPAPGGSSAAPEAVVQRIVLVPAADGLIAPGDSVVVQATPEAQRGTDIYAVPHVPVVFSLLSSAGTGAAVVPSQTVSGDSGVAVVTVRTGDLPGDTVISASAGPASSQLPLHSVARVTGVAVPVVPPLSGTGHRVSTVGGKVAVAALLVAAAGAAALLLGLSRRRGEKPG